MYITARFFPRPALGWAGLNFFVQFFIIQPPLCYLYTFVVVIYLYNCVCSVIVWFCNCVVVYVFRDCHKIGQPVWWHNTMVCCMRGCLKCMVWEGLYLTICLPYSQELYIQNKISIKFTFIIIYYSHCSFTGLENKNSTAQ